MCPSIVRGAHPLACCDDAQARLMLQFFYQMEALVGRCPACLANIQTLFCQYCESVSSNSSA